MPTHPILVYTARVHQYAEQKISLKKFGNDTILLFQKVHNFFLKVNSLFSLECPNKGIQGRQDLLNKTIFVESFKLEQANMRNKNCVHQLNLESTQFNFKIHNVMYFLNVINQNRRFKVGKSGNMSRTSLGYYQMFLETKESCSRSYLTILFKQRGFLKNMQPEVQLR